MDGSLNHPWSLNHLDPDMLERTGDEIATVGDVANHKSAKLSLSTNHQISEY